jgi:hypothetical protein
MKKLLPALLAIMSSFPSLFAKTITVSNNPNSPGQYRRLDSAILAASAGDILLVSGSLTDYFTGSPGGSVTLDRPLTIYGEGYDPRTENALPTTIGVLHLTAAASGTIISGISLGAFYTDANTNNITISRCKIAKFGYSYGGNGTNGINGNNYLLRENVITGIINIPDGHADILILNNIICTSISSASNNTNILISNNFFNGAQIDNLYNATLTNNIIYYKNDAPLASPFVSATVVNCVFTNNIYFNNINSNPLNLGVNQNSGSGNINADPKFVNIDLTPAFSQADNFNLQAGSPAINAGTDGTNIGPEGGSIPMQYPYAGQPAIPLVLQMTITNPVVAPNGTLNVTFKAKSNN